MTNKQNDLRKAQMENKHKFKNDLKVLYTTVLILFPVLIILSYMLNELHIQTWLIVIINVVVGGGICFAVYVINERHKEKQKAKELINEETDPFKD